MCLKTIKKKMGEIKSMETEE